MWNGYRKQERLTSLPWVDSIKLVAVVPDPKDHRGPILAASYKPERLDVFLESVDVDYAVGTRFEAKGVEERVLVA